MIVFVNKNCLLSRIWLAAIIGKIRGCVFGKFRRISVSTFYIHAGERDNCGAEVFSMRIHRVFPARINGIFRS